MCVCQEGLISVSCFSLNLEWEIRLKFSVVLVVTEAHIREKKVIVFAT